MNATLLILARVMLAANFGIHTNHKPHSSEGTLGARVGHSMVYDEARRQMLLFAGTGPEGDAEVADRGSLWAWTGGAWTRLSTTGPRARHGASLVYDANRQRVVMYGGRSGAWPNEALLTDTWEWDGHAWTKVADTGPPARVHQSMAFDRARRVTVLYGGFDISTQKELRDIWEWNGNAWAAAPAGVSSGVAAGVAYDERTSALHLLTRDGAGYFMDTWNGSALVRRAAPVPSCVSSPVSLSQSRGGLLSAAYCAAASAMQTWRLEGERWVQMPGAQPDGPRINAAMAYDRDRDRVVLFGGEGLAGGSFSDTWEWDGANWIKAGA
jgi:hypothetical protein